MGFIQIPTLPQWMVFTDRTLGTLWTLSHTPDHDRVKITDLPPDKTKLGQYHIFPAFEEPYLGDNPTFRVFADNAHLGYEVVKFPPGVMAQNQAEIGTRNLKEPFTREIRTPDPVNYPQWRVGKGLAHVPVNF